MCSCCVHFSACALADKVRRVDVPDTPFSARTNCLQPASVLQPALLSCKLSPVFLQAEDEARSLELRQQGNAAFKQGELHQALAWHWQAVALNPGDSALLNNISLACLKQGDVQQVRLAALACSWLTVGVAERLALLPVRPTFLYPARLCPTRCILPHVSHPMCPTYVPVCAGAACS
jgi:hypothetical protein